MEPRSENRFRATWLGLLALALLGILHASSLWRGPWGADGVIYTDLALLSPTRSEVAWRYLHVYFLAGASWLTGSLPRGAGYYALAVYLLAVAVVAAASGRLAGSGARWLGLLLAASCPLFLDGATTPYCDLPAVAYAGLSLLLLDRALGAGRLVPSLLSGAGLLVALRSKETAICVVAGLVVLAVRAPVDRRKRVLFFGGAGFVLALVAGAALDGWLVGDVFWALRPASAQAYAQFNLRPVDGNLGGGTLIEHLAGRWLVPYSLMALAGLVACRRSVLCTSLGAWSATAALFHGTAISASDFGANERYVIPVLLPLLPLAAAWLQHELSSWWLDFKGSPRLALAVWGLGLLVLLGGQALVQHFIRKAMHQLVPVAWATAVAFMLAVGVSPAARRLARTLLPPLLAATVLASFYSARQMARHHGQVSAQWSALAAAAEEFRDGTIGVAAPNAPFLEACLRIHAGSASWRLRRLDSKEVWPDTAIVDAEHARAAEAQGLTRVGTYSPLTYGPLQLWHRP